MVENPIYLAVSSVQASSELCPLVKNNIHAATC